MLHGDVHREDWRKSIAPFVTVLREECQLKERLEQCSVTDAKSLFDAVSNENSSSKKDRRTAIELAIILENLRRSKSSVRWSPHPRMVADVLTKDNIAKSNGALEELLRTSRLALWDESEELQLRQSDPSKKLRSRKAAERMRASSQQLLSFSCLVNLNFGELMSIFHQVCFT